MNEADRALLHDLIAEHLDGSLSESQRQSLNTLLQRSEEARVLYVDAMRRDVQLREILLERHELQNLANKPIATNAFKRSPLWLRASAIGAIAAAICVIVFVVRGGKIAPQQVEPAITLATVATADSSSLLYRNNTQSPLSAGETLRSSDRIESNAKPIELQYPDGTKITLAAKSVTTIAAYGAASTGKRLALDKGSLTADVTPQLPGLPMIVSTADAEATVIGTRFTLTARDDSSTLEVEHGRVRFMRKKDQQSVDVTAGQRYDSSAIATDTAPVTPPPPKAVEILFVTARRVPFFAHDVVIKEALDQNHFNVIEKLDAEVTAADAQGKALIVISSYLCSKKRVFRDVNVPVIVWHRNWFEDLGMSELFQSRSDGTPLQRLAFARFDHPLAGGLKSTDFAPNDPRVTLPIFATGRPGKDAIVIASLNTSPDEAVLFGFEKGAMMDGVIAPARRVAFSLHLEKSDGLDVSADVAQRLFQAAIRWCIN